MKKVSNVKNSGPALLASFFFTIYIIIGLFLNTTINFPNWYTFAKGIQYISIIGLILISIILIFLYKYKISWLNIFLFIGGIINLITAKHIFILFLALSLFTLKKCDVMYIVRLHFYSLIFVLLITFLLAKFGLIENIISYRYENGIPMYPRYGFGFKAVTLPLSILFFILIDHLILKIFKFNFINYLVYLIIAIYLFYYTRTRTGFLLVLLLLTFNILTKITFFDKILNLKIVNTLVSISPIILTIITFIMCWFYNSNNEFLFELNFMLTGRLELTHNLFNKYGLTLFGSVINVNQNGFYIGSDISYLFYMLDYGLVNLFLILILLFTTIRKCKNSNTMYLVILVFVILNSLVEPYLIDLKYHVIFILPLMKNFITTFINKNKISRKDFI